MAKTSMKKYDFPIEHGDFPVKHGGSFPRKIVIFPRKIAIFPRKTVIIPWKLVISRENWWIFPWFLAFEVHLLQVYRGFPRVSSVSAQSPPSADTGESCPHRCRTCPMFFWVHGFIGDYNLVGGWATPFYPLAILLTAWNGSIWMNIPKIWENNKCSKAPTSYRGLDYPINIGY